MRSVGDTNLVRGISKVSDDQRARASGIRYLQVSKDLVNPFLFIDPLDDREKKSTVQKAVSGDCSYRG